MQTTRRRHRWFFHRLPQLSQQSLDARGGAAVAFHLALALHGTASEEPPESGDFALFATSVAFVAQPHVPILARAQSELCEAGPSICAPPVGVPIGMGGGRLIANPGSVGQNRIDNDTAAFAIVDWDCRLHAAAITFHRVPYGVDADLARLKAVRMPASLVEERKQFLRGKHHRVREVRNQYATLYPLCGHNTVPAEESGAPVA